MWWAVSGALGERTYRICYDDLDFISRGIMSILEKLEQHLSVRSQQEEFSGVVSLEQGGQTIFDGAYGYAHRGFKIRNQLNTRFRMASISKLFTAVATLQLIEVGRLDFHTQVAGALGLEGTKIPAEATVYHMLTMTSGMADWFEESGNWEADWAALIREHPIYLFRKNEDYLPLFAHLDPLFPVGERHQYNGAGYILLGMLIEKLSGHPYFDYVQQNVFERAGMNRTGFLALDGVDEDAAEGYIPIHDAEERITGWKKNIYSTTVEAAADGGASSTAADIISFAQALRSGKLLGPDMTGAMLTPQVLEDDEKVEGYTWMYGFANMFLLDESGRIVRWGHTGEEDGVSCRLYHYPGADLDVAIMGNQSWCAGELSWEIHRMIVEAFGLS
jgi:CubicO group peptidase (beta-lactamase class C family)